MPSADDAPIINRFKASCTQLRNRFRWPMQCATALGLQTIYLADLDAIAGLPPRFDVYRELIAARFHLWIDAGVRNPATVAPLLELDPDFTTIVAGLETMAGRRELAEIIRIAGAERIVFSLDLFEESPQTAAEATWGNEDAFDLALAAMDCGVQNLLILDLARVGTGRGLGSQTLIAQIRGARPFAHIHAGGGISRIEEVLAIRDAGAAGVLIGSAIHDGRIGTRELERINAPAIEGSSFRRLDVSAPLHLRRLAKALLNFDTHDAGEFPTAGGHRLAKPSRDIVREQLSRGVGDGK